MHVDPRPTVAAHRSSAPSHPEPMDRNTPGGFNSTREFLAIQGRYFWADGSWQHRRFNDRHRQLWEYLIHHPRVTILGDRGNSFYMGNDGYAERRADLSFHTVGLDGHTYGNAQPTRYPSIPFDSERDASRLVPLILRWATGEFPYIVDQDGNVNMVINPGVSPDEHEVWRRFDREGNPIGVYPDIPTPSHAPHFIEDKIIWIRQPRHRNDYMGPPTIYLSNIDLSEARVLMELDESFDCPCLVSFARPARFD